MDLLNRIGAKWLGAAIADGLVRDFRYAQRSLRKDYRFSLVAILALALGIGASTVVFTVV
jgi:putative ABC transport system permease protein